MSAEYVRRYYGVPAKRGQRVTVEGRPGVIVSFPGQYIGVRFDGDKITSRCHPTWEVDYDPPHEFNENVSGHWEAAVEAGAREYAYQEEVDYDDMLAYWAQPNVHADNCFKLAAAEVLTAALPHLRRHIIAELQAKAEAQAQESAPILGGWQMNSMVPDRAAFWLRNLAQEEAPDA